MVDDTENIIKECLEAISSLEREISGIKAEQAKYFKQEKKDLTALVRDAIKEQKHIKKDILKVAKGNVSTMKENFNECKKSEDIDKTHITYSNSQNIVMEMKMQVYEDVESAATLNSTNLQEFESNMQKMSFELQKVHQERIGDTKEKVRELLKARDHRSNQAEIGKIHNLITASEREYSKLWQRINKIQREMIDDAKQNIMSLDIELREEEKKSYNNYLDILETEYMNTVNKIRSTDESNREEKREQSKRETEERLKAGKEESDKKKHEADEKFEKYRQEREEQLHKAKDDNEIKRREDEAKLAIQREELEERIAEGHEKTMQHQGKLEQHKKENEERIKIGKEISKHKKDLEEKKRGVVEQSQEEISYTKELHDAEREVLEANQALIGEINIDDEKAHLTKLVEKLKKEQDELNITHSTIVKQEQQKLDDIIKEVEEKKAYLVKQEKEVIELDGEINKIIKAHEGIGSENLTDEAKERGEMLKSLIGRAYEKRDAMKTLAEKEVNDIYKEVEKKIKESERDMQEKLDGLFEKHNEMAAEIEGKITKSGEILEREKDNLFYKQSEKISDIMSKSEDIHKQLSQHGKDLVSESQEKLRKLLSYED